MATTKQKIAAKKVLKGSNISKAMREAGYAPTTAANTGKLTNSKGWQELMEKHISDEELARVHQEGLSASKIHGTQDDFIEVPDYSVRHKYLDTAYKLKGKMVDKSVRFNVDIASVLDEIENGQKAKRQELADGESLQD